MRRISDWLLPGFLKRRDRFLLEHYPTVWRTRIHFVLFYGLPAFAPLFIAGMLYPISIGENKLTVDPIEPIHISSETYFYIFSGFAILGILFWGFSQYNLQHQTSSFKSVFIRLLLYAVGLFVILGLDTTAFRLGTITRTAYGLMDDEHIERADSVQYFRYGFVYSQNSIGLDAAAYYKRGEKLLQIYCLHEDTILQNRYNQRFFDLFFDRLHRSGIIDWSDRSDLSYFPPNLPDLSYLSFLSDLSHLPSRSNLLYLPYLPGRSHLTYLSYLSGRSGRLILSVQLIRSDVSYRLVRWYRSVLSDRPVRWHLSDLSSRPLQAISDYYSYFQLTSKDTSLFVETGISLSEKDTLWHGYGEIPFIFPLYPYLLEDGVRSVKHARLYLREGIVFRHYKSLLIHLPLIVILFFSFSFLSYPKSLGTLVLFGAIGIGVENIGVTFEQYNSLLFAFPLLGLLPLIYFALRQRQLPFAFWAFHFVLWGVLSVLFFALFGSNSREFLSRPNDFAFFGVELIGLAAVVLMAYVSRMPKSG
ncbi:MAG: hypothetical protein J5I98_17820 [Phaeodactylibacter sp.]|nr:hypothetical protein [Phaeodactylibacter sp.]